MYFSRVMLNPQASDQQLAQMLCQDSYREHQVLWQLFDTDPNASRDFLYRQVIENGRMKYYLLSQRQPFDKTGLWLIDGPKPYDPQLTIGQSLYFSLRANPTIHHKVDRKNPQDYLKARAKRNVKNKTKLTKKRVQHDVVMHEKTRIGYSQLPDDQQPMLQQLVQDTCIPWLQQRAKTKGFELLTETVQADGYQLHKSHAKRQKRLLQYSTVDFQGILKVIDPDKFRTALFAGIGKSKAFGCGLLLIKRV